MAHYAFLEPTDNDNILLVVNTIVGVDENDTETLPSEFSNWEEFYSNQSGYIVKRYSYNTIGNQHLQDGTPFRGNACGTGDWYDIENDVFYGAKPYDSWVLNTSTWSWEAPVPYPETVTGTVEWNEETQNWVDNS